MKEIIKIQSIEKKVGKSGNEYIRYKTDKGYMSCFEDAINTLLLQNKNKAVEVSIRVSGAYKNIIAFHQAMPEWYNKDIADTAQLNTPHWSEEKDELVNKGVKEIKVKNNDRDVMMLTSYAKDIFIAMKEKLGKLEDGEMVMDYAIELVKRAKKKLS